MFWCCSAAALVVISCQSHRSKQSTLSTVQIHKKATPSAIAETTIENGNRKSTEHKNLSPTSRTTDAAAAAAMRRLARLDDDGEIKRGSLLRAKRHADAMPILGLSDGGVVADAGLWSWEWMGPGNIGGRVRSIVFQDPTTMLAGSVSGGLWRSTDTGASWTPVNDFIPSLAITSIALDPIDPTIIYVATGEGFNVDGVPGTGVFKSINDGTTWTQLPDTAGWQFVNRIAINPQNGQHLLAGVIDWAGGSANGIYRSDDGGQSWNPTSLMNRNAQDVKFNPSDPMKVIAGLNDGNIAYSTDGGTTWTLSIFDSFSAASTLSAGFAADADTNDDILQLDSTFGFSPKDLVRVGGGGNADVVTVSTVNASAATLTVADLTFSHSSGAPVSNLRKGRSEVAYAPPDGNIVYAAMNVGKGTIWRSTDGGATFSLRSNTDDDYLGKQGNYDNIIWVSPLDSNFVVVGGIQLWRSTNGGSSLTQISDSTQFRANRFGHADHHAIVPSPTFGANNDFTVYIGNDGGIERATNITTVTTSRGWTRMVNSLGITQFYGGAADATGRYILGGAQDNGVSQYQASNGPSAPQTWRQLIFADGGYCAIDPLNPAIQYGSWQFLRIRKSTDFGDTFSTATNGIADSPDNSDGDQSNAKFIAPFSMAPSDADTLVAGGISIWRTTNAAANWVSIRSPLAPERDCTAIDIADYNPDVIWVGYESKGAPTAVNGRVSRTLDGGSSWLDVDTNGPNPLPNRSVTDISINPSNSNEVFVSFGGYQSNSVWRTTNAGATWEQRTGTGANSLPPIQINTVRVHPYASNWVYVGTDLGIYASEDKGLTWSVMPQFGDHEGPINVEVQELFWQSENLIAATYGRGMYRARPFPVVHVDKHHLGLEEGTLVNPFDTINEGKAASGPGWTIAIRSETYYEGPMTFSTPGRVVAVRGRVRIE